MPCENLRILVRARTIAASMAIERPGTTDAAQLAAAAKRRTAQERFSCFARNDGFSRQGKKIAMRGCGIGGRGEAGLRPDQPIGEAVLERSLNDEKAEIMATSRDRQEMRPVFHQTHHSRPGRKRSAIIRPRLSENARLRVFRRRRKVAPRSNLPTGFPHHGRAYGLNFNACIPAIHRRVWQDCCVWPSNGFV